MKKHGRKSLVNRLFTSALFTLTFGASAFAGNLESVLKGMGKHGTRVSAKIVNLTNTRVLLDVNGHEALNPASSIKLFTAYSALKRLGINHTFKTTVYRGADGGMCVKGGGDPSFVMEDLYLLVQGLKRKGLESYSGKIKLDSTVYDEEFYPEDRSDQNSERAYNAPISGLNFNYNTISVFVNPTEKGKPAHVGLDFPFSFVKIQGRVMTGTSTDVTWDKKGQGDEEIISLGGKIAEDGDEWRKPFRIRKPAMAFGQALQTMLSEAGIDRKGVPSISEGTCLGEPYFTYSSKPLSFVVQLMDKYSNNFIADSLVKSMDHEVNHRSGTAEGGLRFMRTEMLKYGVNAEAKGRSLVSGSGLTNGNRMAADDFITLLKQIHKEKRFLPEIFASLPIAGVDGTLKRKYEKSEVADRLRGKTGTLSGVQSLVGVYPNDEGEWLGVAVLVNGGHGIPEVELGKFLSSH
jgi:D-alanyl-D-alanine carboxypeptidase/D-alanyl-D-alanine-endopeptidase (penicillin-binding protein 4)